MASSLLFASPSLAFVEFPSIVTQLFVIILEPEFATISIDYVTSEVQPLSCPSNDSSALVVKNYSTSSPDPYYRTCSPGWVVHLEKPYQLGTITPPVIAVSTGRRCYKDVDGTRIIVLVSSRDDVLPSIFLFQYEAAFSGLLDVCRFVLGTHFNGHEILKLTVSLTWPRLVADCFVNGSVLGSRCRLALALSPENGYAVHSFDWGSDLWNLFSLRNVIPLTFRLRFRQLAELDLYIRCPFHFCLSFPSGVVSDPMWAVSRVFGCRAQVSKDGFFFD